MQIIGQNNNKELIEKWQTLPQFIIVLGDEHTGKTCLVQQLCKKFGLYYKKMNNGVNDVRNLINVMTENSNTVYHFKNFHTATLRAKNALLKITEEPIAGNYIIITGSSQLKTLESRARTIIMEPYSKDDVCSYMKKYYNNDSLIERLYNAGFTTPAIAYSYREYERIEPLLNFAQDIFNKLTYLKPDDIIHLTLRFQNRYEGIDSCLLFLNLLSGIIEYNIKTTQVYDYYNILNIIMEEKTTLLRENTLNRRFLMYRIFYRIYLLRESAMR